VAKSFTISTIKYGVGSLAAHQIVPGLFAAVENFKNLRVELKND